MYGLKSFRSLLEISSNPQLTEGLNLVIRLWMVSNRCESRLEPRNFTRVDRVSRDCQLFFDQYCRLSCWRIANKYDRSPPPPPVKILVTMNDYTSMDFDCPGDRNLMNDRVEIEKVCCLWRCLMLGLAHYASWRTLLHVPIKLFV